MDHSTWAASKENKKMNDAPSIVSTLTQNMQGGGPAMGAGSMFDLLKKDTVMKAAAQGTTPPSPELTLAQQRTGQTSPGSNVMGPFQQAQKDLRLTPQETALYQEHLTNLHGPGGVRNANGSISTLYQMGVQGPDGRQYNIPTVYNGKILSGDQAIQKAQERGWNTFPSYATPAEGEARYHAMHPYMDQDVGNKLAAEQAMRPAGIPATVPSGVRFTEDTPVETQLNHNAHDSPSDVSPSDAKKAPRPGSAQSYQAPPLDAEPPDIRPKAFHSAMSIAMRRVGLMPKIPQTQPGPEILTDVSTLAKPGYNLSENDQLQQLDE